MKKELELPCDIPVILGELGDFLGTYANGKFRHYKQINNVLKGLRVKVPYIALASAEGLICRCGGIHFDSASYRTLANGILKLIALL